MTELPYDATERALALLNDQVVLSVFSRLESVYLNEIRNSKIENKEAREIAYQRLKALDELRTDMERIANSKAINAFNRKPRVLSRLTG